MSVDLAQLQRIHSLEGEIAAAELELRAVKERRTELITELPEFKDLENVRGMLRTAEVKLKLAIRDDRELNALYEQRGEVSYHLHDLRDMLSHHLVAYHPDTGRDVVKDSSARNRQIELSARLSKPGKRVMDQTKLSFSQHFGVRVAIPEAPVAKQLELTQEKK
ncbi:hypothetical protein [Arthrobacter burdickii]|uniref:Uncharacterized protein n=1 Tax=Arthrobacter burdickii TaxID=3035920 RepID=A0ABT8K2P3_9MICC|nr:hypothetical protein [Arthrobacter burdickii]MDN4611457.1 hypothetical protein [Arthrobacter burdickii]